MSQSFDELKTLIIDIFKTLKYQDYNIIEEPTLLRNAYIFYIKLKNTEIIISSVTIYIRSDAVSFRQTKSAKEDKEVKVLHISSVFTSPEHAGKKLAILLLMYAISYIKSQATFTDVLYSTLDDCSDRSTIITENIYHKLGFVPCGHTSLNEDQGPLSITSTGEPLQIVLDGPEKIANLTEFLPRAYAVIYNNIQGRGKKIKRKSYKRKSYKRKSYKRKQK